MIEDGPVTIRLVVICFSVCAASLAAFTYFINRFQTKQEAKEIERHLTTWIQGLEDKFNVVRGELARISENVSYIRGSLEQRNSKEE